MKNTVPVTAITLELDEKKPQSLTRARPGHLWVEGLSLVLLMAAVFVGIDFWRDWFSSVDRVICSVCVLIGLSIAFARSDWIGGLSKRRFVLGLSLLQLRLS